MRPNSDSQYAGGPVNWRIITSLIPYLTEFRGRVALAMGSLLLAKLAGVAVPWALKLSVEHFEDTTDFTGFLFQALNTQGTFLHLFRKPGY